MFVDITHHSCIQIQRLKSGAQAGKESVDRTFPSVIN